MTNQIEIEESEQKFLIELSEQTKGDASAQISMYDIGAALGMDRNESSRAAETLMSWGLAEVRTLSGGIGITAEGLEDARKLGAVTGSLAGAGPRLGDAPIMDDLSRQGSEQIVMVLKNQTGKLALDFDVLTELMADLKTIDAQLTSSKPKTAIIRECFRSVKGILEKAGTDDSLAQVRALLGE